MACRQRRGGEVIHHSDQGTHRQALQDLERPSMGSVDDCFDNAIAESFFAGYVKLLLPLRQSPGFPIRFDTNCPSPGKYVWWTSILRMGATRTVGRTVSLSFRVTSSFARLLVRAAAHENRSKTNLVETLAPQFCRDRGIEIDVQAGPD